MPELPLVGNSAKPAPEVKEPPVQATPVDQPPPQNDAPVDVPNQSTMDDPQPNQSMMDSAAELSTNGGGEFSLMQKAPASVPGEPDQDDATPTYINHVEDRQFESDYADLKASLGGGKPSTSDSAPAAPAVPGDGVLKTTGKVAADVVVGGMESFWQTAGGVRDAAQAMINLPEDAAVQLLKWTADAQGGAEGELLNNYLKERTQKGIRETPQLPTVAPAKTVTGAMVRGTAQFLTGFYGAGKVLPAAAEGAGGIVKVIEAMAKGSTASFAAFNGHEKKLSDLINQFPALRNPVTEYLAAGPNDTDLEGRFKAAVEGELPGILAKGLISAVKLIKFGKVVEAGTNYIKRIEGEPLPPKEIDPQQAFAAIGDPTVEKTIIREGDKIPSAAGGEAKIAEGQKATEGVTPESIGAPATSDKTYINFARMDSPEAIKATIKQMAEDFAASVKDAARGTRSWAETKLSAAQQDAWKLLSERRQEAPLNAEESLAARQLWVTSAAKLKETAALAAAAPSDANLFAFRKMLSVHYAIQKEVMAARTETARALNAWKIPAGSGKEMAAAMEEMVSNAGGFKTTKYLAEKIKALGDAGLDAGVEKMVQGGWGAKSMDAVRQLWINSLLSNPASQAANFISNAGRLAIAVGDRATAEFLSQKLGTEGGVALGETMAMIHGGMSAMQDAIVACSKRVKQSGSVKGAAKDFWGWLKQTEAMKGESNTATKALSADTLGAAPDTMLGKTLDVVDTVSRSPGRLLSGSDDFFKMIGYRMELHAQAVRMAKNELAAGKIGADAVESRIAQIIENPPDTVHLDAESAAKVYTFTQEPAAVLKGLGDAIQKVPVVGRMVLPFKKTPANIFTDAMERTPLAPLVKSWRADIAAGGARGDLAKAKYMTGTTLMWLGMDASVRGQVTGRGPSHPEERQNWLANHRPYSIKINGVWHAYNRLDPLGMTLGLAADMGSVALNAQNDLADDEMGDVLTAAAFAIGNNVLSKSYMQGAADLIGALANPDLRGKKYLQRLTGSLIPGAVASLQKHGTPLRGLVGDGLNIPPDENTGIVKGILQGDQYMRVVDGVFVQPLMNRLPGLSQKLPLYRDLWGRTVNYRSELGWGFDVVSPVYIKKDNPEPVDLELQRLKYFPDMPKREVSRKGYGTVKLTTAQYARWMELSGNGFKDPAHSDLGCKDFLNEVFTKKSDFSDIYWDENSTDGPQGSRADFIENTIRMYRRQALEALVEEDQALAGQFELQADKKRNEGK